MNEEGAYLNQFAPVPSGEVETPPSDWAIEENVRCVVCPTCAFTFDAVHTDEPDGGYSCPLCEPARGEVETPCATCGGTREVTEYQEWNISGMLHSERFPVRRASCPDCGVETPEAAVEAGAEAVSRFYIDQGFRLKSAVTEYDRSTARVVIDLLIAQGWTPPGGPE